MPAFVIPASPSFWSYTEEEQDESAFGGPKGKSQTRQERGAYVFDILKSQQGERIDGALSSSSGGLGGSVMPHILSLDT